MDKKQIILEDGLKAIGTYSNAIQVDNTVYYSGVLPVDEEGNIVEDDIAKQTMQVVENMEEALSAANLSLNHIVKTTVFVTNMEYFQKVNQIFAIYFNPPYPARSCVEVSRLPKDALIEIEFIAIRNLQFADDDECEGCRYDQ